MSRTVAGAPRAFASRACHPSGMDTLPGRDGHDAVLIVNLGTPSAPTAAAVKRYLAEFLHDHRVVQLTRWIWCPILHFLILPLRSPKVAHKYAEVWMDDGSPLLVHTRNLAAAMDARTGDVPVSFAMRYGTPPMKGALQALHDAGARRVLVLPLYPQYSTTTTASVVDVAHREDTPARMRVVEDYAVDAGWVEAIVQSIRAHWELHGRGELLLFSYHGIPQRLADGGDPYEQRCRASTAAVVTSLGLETHEWTLAFQSRFGREPWLKPATDDTLALLAGRGKRHVDVICPGFAVDCLETLEEISMENATLFREAAEHHARSQGVVDPAPARLAYIPCLNDAPAHADALAALALRELAAWADASPAA